MYLDPRAFITCMSSGEYQNGGSWLIYDYLALATDCIDGSSAVGNRMAGRLRMEFQYGPVLHEYLNTDPKSPLARSEPAIRDGFFWDTFILQVDQFLRERATPDA